VGKLYYDENNLNVCDPLDLLQPLETKYSPFFISERGDCTFVKKIRNMENAGIAVGIIYDNKDENPDALIMSDDGTGGGLKIPSMLISNIDGKKLVYFIKRASKEELDQIAIMASFDLEKPDNRVEYDFWFTTSNDKALDFLVEFSKTDQELGEKVLMTPHYVFWNCPYCE
jgi:hypothetical protein